MIIAILSHTLELIPLQVSRHESSKRANNFLLMAYQLPREIQHIIWTHEFYLVIFYISTAGPGNYHTTRNLSQSYTSQNGQKVIHSSMLKSTRD